MNRPDFEAIKRIANGELQPEVYARIFGIASEAPEGNFVEVGAAHGAATISLALAVKERSSPPRIYSFEKIEGGSRERYGGRHENLEILRRNFSRFGVADIVRLIPRDVATAHGEVDADLPLGLMMLDADGAIDRDLKLFYNRLVPGAPIIIDDCQDLVKIKRLKGREVRVDLKHVLTYHLVSRFVAEGLIEKEFVVDGTFFGRKPTTALTPVDFTSMNLVATYRKLTFTSGHVPTRSRVWGGRFLSRHPRLRRWVRRALRW